MKQLGRSLSFSLSSIASLTLATVVAVGAPTGAVAAAPPIVTDPASVVNTLVATTGGGNVFPGPAAPFGMIQWSPDTRRRTDGGGYRYDQTQLRGFSLTHISGPGCGAYQDVPILPLTGGLPAGDPGSFQESFTHTGEVATAGYYSVRVGSPAITAELTSTRRSAMGRFTFPSTTNANILMKLLDSQNGTMASSAQIVGHNEVQGAATSGHFCGAPDTYTVHFDITFDHPFTASQVITEAGQPGPNSVFLTFDTTANQVLQAKVGISFVSVGNAKLNWQTDNPNWDFNAVRSASHAAWNALLSRIQIGGGTPTQQQLFYTMLYRVLLHPNIWSDANGQYVGFDQAIHTMPAGHAQYANYSGWDTYHSQSQLAALLAPQESSDQAQSLLNDYAQDNLLPPWGFANSNNYVMVGDPAQAILADYYAFGATSFDTATALHDMIAQATTVNDVRPGTAMQTQYGYLPVDGSYGCCNFHGTAATLLEDTQEDVALAQFASALNDSGTATRMVKRAQDWQNIFNAGINLFNPKLTSGQFTSGMTPTSSDGMVEGSSAQYRWIVPFNHASLIAAMGGNQAVNPLLDSFFSGPLDGSSDTGAFLANEFELGVQMFYNYTRQPWKTQAVVNRMRNELFQDTPTGLKNNDDLGALSSMYVWSALGMYPTIPGNAQLDISGPAFPLSIVHLGNGSTITINAPGASPSNPYIQSLKFNGHPYHQLWFDPSLITGGGTLDYALGSAPNTFWGTAPQDTPPSYGTQYVAAIGFASPDNQILTPGSATTVSLGAQSTWTSPQTISWVATPSSGVTVSPTMGSFTVNQGGRRSVPVTITAGSTEGRETVSFQLSSSTGVSVGKVVVGLALARPGELWPYYNNVGITDDSAMGAGAFDGGCCSYSAQALQAAGITPGGPVTVNGFSYTWPDVPAGQLDNINAGGQTVQLNPTTGKTQIGILGAADNVGSRGSSGTLTVTYGDGTSQQIAVAFSDWTLGAGGFGPLPSNATAATTAYRNCTCGVHDYVKTYVFAISANLTAGKTVESITLPANLSGGDFHIFDLAFR